MKNLSEAYSLYKGLLKTENRPTKAVKAIAYIFAVIVITVSVLVTEPYGSKEYFIGMAILPIGFVSSFIAEICSFATTNSRFFASSPYAADVMTKLKPIMAIIRCLIFTGVSVLSLFIWDAFGFTDFSILSDMLLSCSAGVLIKLFSSGLSIQIGMFAGVYLCAAPFFILLFGKYNPVVADILAYGFNLPLWASALILAASFIVGGLLAFKLSEYTYKRRDTRYLNAIASAANLNK